MFDVTKRLKEHVWCIVIIAAIILLALITLSFSKDANLVSHLSLTGAVVSIVLAVIVIVYMYFQDNRSLQNITEMRNLVLQASEVMAEKADTVSQEAQSIGDVVKQLIEITAVKGEEEVEPQDIQLQPEITRITSHILIILYCLGKTYDCSKKIPSSLLTEALFPESDDTRGQLGYVLGVITYLQCLWGHKNIEWHEENNKIVYKANKIPKGLSGDVLKEINRRIAKDVSKEKLEGARERIDAYFEAA